MHYCQALFFASAKLPCFYYQYHDIIICMTGQQTIGRQARTVPTQQIGRLGDIFQTVGWNVWKSRNCDTIIQQMRAGKSREENQVHNI